MERGINKMNITPRTFVHCPLCDGQPTIELAIYGYGYFAQCNQCGWEGYTRDVEVCPSDALEHWFEKAIDYQKLNIKYE